MSDDRNTANSDAGSGEPASKDKQDYEVGYGRPPRHSRFKPGQSGNRKGRPRGTRNLKTDLEEELSEKISLREDGHSKTVSKQRAVVKALTAKAIKGDVKASSQVIAMALRLLQADEPVGEDKDELSDDELDLLADLIARRRGEPTQ